MRSFFHPTVGLYSVWFSEMLRHAGLPLRRDFRVCDIGCGLGYHCFRLEREVAEVYGFDISEETITWLRRYPHRVIFEVLDICADPPPYVDTFDRAFSSDVYEHVDDPLRMLQNTWSMLRPGGRLVFTFPNHRHHGHNQVESAYELGQLIRKVGFSTCRIEVVERPGKMYALWLEQFQRLRFWSDRWSGTQACRRSQEADLIHETTGYRKSQRIERVPMLALTLNLLMVLFARAARRYPIYETAPEGADVREKRLLVVASK